jgi:MFS family permease
MKPSWMNSVLPIAAIFSFRMLGLFMLIPVFTVYAIELKDETPALIGIALGSYGLSQGLLQMPMGMLSDRFGRKRIIAIGLTLFVLGSLWGALTTSIYGMIAARVIQGTGAVGSVLIALLADLTPDTMRTKAMAVVGATIGLSFSLAMVLSPGIAYLFGLSGIFYFTVILGLIGLMILWWIIPSPPKEPFHYDAEAKPRFLKEVLKNPHLQRLNAGIFSQHFILTSTFFAIPIILQQFISDNSLTSSWTFYLPIMFFSFIAMVPFIVLAERKHKMKPVFLVSVSLIAICQFFLAFGFHQLMTLATLVFVYFIAFNFLEASLPSLVSKQADPKAKGTGMGVYSTAQFLGIFLGGTVAGFAYKYTGSQGIFMINGLLAICWLLIALFMKPNDYLTTLTIPFDTTVRLPSETLTKLQSIHGVKQVVISKEENTIYFKINKEQYTPGSIETTLHPKR